MQDSPIFFNQRKDVRIDIELPIRISIGSQLTMHGVVCNLSLRSAFIKIKNSVYIQPNDEVSFSISSAMEKEDDYIYGKACISRIVPGDGFAIYFTIMEENSTKNLNKVMGNK